MISKENPHNQIYECGPSETIILPKGEVGKTKKTLVGCLIPILQYRDRIIIGHFGPRETEKAVIRIGNILHPVIPDQVFIHHNSMTDDSFWSYHIDEYLALLENMIERIATITHVSKHSITKRSYPTFSDVHVDWSRTNDPRIYTLPSSDTHI